MKKRSRILPHVFFQKNFIFHFEMGGKGRPVDTAWGAEKFQKSTWLKIASRKNQPGNYEIKLKVLRNARDWVQNSSAVHTLIHERPQRSPEALITLRFGRAKIHKPKVSRVPGISCTAPRTYSPTGPRHYTISLAPCESIVKPLCQVAAV